MMRQRTIEAVEGEVRMRLEGKGERKSNLFLRLYQILPYTITDWYYSIQ